MRYEEQILKLNEYTIAFLSDTCCIITKDIDKALNYETMYPVDVNKMVKNTRSSIGFPKFYFSLKNRMIYFNFRDKKYSIDELIRLASDFQSIDLKVTSRFLVYKKGSNIFVSLPEGDYTYLNRNNVFLKKHLGNTLYMQGLDKNQVLEKCKMLTKSEFPISNIVLDENIIDNDELKGINLTYKNDLSPNNPFYFVDNSSLKISNTGVKPILTKGFSRNNMLNYFDINISNNYNQLINYLTNDLNYNKHYFNELISTECSLEFLCRLVQINCFMPVMFFENNKCSVLEFNEDNIYFKTVIKYAKLRHRLIPFLYSVFKSKRVFYKDVYKRLGDHLLVGDIFLIAPIVSEIDKSINQNFVNIKFDNIYYDIQSEEKFYNGNIQDFFGIDKLPVYAAAGSILPLAINNDSHDYEVIVYPNGNKEFTLHYDEYVVGGDVHHAYSIFKVTYQKNKMVFTITPHLIKELAPTVFRLNFINIKKDSNVVVTGSTHKIDYNNDKKYLLIDINDTMNDVEVVITNNYGVEIDRCEEYLDNKLINYFNNFDLDSKEKLVYKYKVRPYLHENLEGITSRIDKHIKFINKKQKKNLYKMIAMYKK